MTDSETAKIGFEDIGELATQSAYCTEVNVTEAARELFGVEIPLRKANISIVMPSILRRDLILKKLNGD